MSQNLIDLNLSSDSLAQMDAALTTLESELSQLRGLDARTRRHLTKMGEKSEAFCREAVTAFGEHADVLPRNFDVAAYRRDLDALDALRPRRQRVARLQELMEHAEVALGSDLMTASLEGYAVLKLSGKDMGLDSLRQSLSARFRKPRSKATEGTTDPA